MNSPWGTNLITARKCGFVCDTLNGEMVKAFAVSQVEEVTCPVELHKHLHFSEHLL